MSIHWGGRGAGHISRWSSATTGVPSLALDFLSGSLDSRVSFSRASTATVIDSSGSIQSSPVNSPRFDFDPATLTQRGLLIEEPRTNLLTNSLISAVPLLTQNVTVTAVPHTLSFYGTGTITLTGASVATVTGTGVYPNRRTITFTPIAGVLICTVVGIVQFAQLEIGSFATSFIPTAASAVARSADVALMTGTNFSSFYNQSEGSWLAAFSPYVGSSGVVAQISASTNLNRFQLLSDSTNQIAVTTANVGQGTIDAGTIIAGGINKLSYGYRTNDTSASLNGGATVADNTVTLPVVDRLCIGATVSPAGFLNGHIRQIAYYNKRLLNSQLQALTV